MKSGFRVLYRLLLEFCFRTPDAVGLVLPGGRKVYNFLKESGFNVEYNTSVPKYNYIYVPTDKFSTFLLGNLLTHLEKRGIILARVSKIDLKEIMNFIAESPYYVYLTVHKADDKHSYLKFYKEGKKDELQYQRGFRVYSRFQ